MPREVVFVRDMNVDSFEIFADNQTVGMYSLLGKYRN